MPTSMPVRSGVDASRPGIADRADRRRALAGAARPALARELRQRRRRLAVDHRLHVVERRIGRAGEIDAARIVEAMLARVPAPGGQVEPAGERHRVVDHDDLLMLRGAERQVVVEAEADPPRRAPAQRHDRKQLALDARRGSNSPRPGDARGARGRRSTSALRKSTKPSGSRRRPGRLRRPAGCGCRGPSRG